MNTAEMIDEVIDIVDDPYYEDRVKLLASLNQSQRAVAGVLLLPNLADGYDSVNTVTDGFMVDMPGTFHKGLFLAQCDGSPIYIHEDIKSFSMITGGMSKDNGDVSGVAVNGKKLVYQKVPAAATAIELFFYRKPVDMTDAADSYPDGLTDNDEFDWAIIHDTCKKIWSKMEDGIEGQKVNTLYHEGKYDQKIEELDKYADREGKSFATRPPSGQDWLGGN